jgi:thiol:disulfide interchange protein
MFLSIIHKHRFLSKLAVVSILTFYSFAIGQQDGPSLAINVLQAKQRYAPGDTVLIALDVGIPANYHLYGNPLGPGIGKPLAITLRGGAGVAWLDLLKTAPGKFTPAVGGWVYAYEKQAVFCLRGIARDVGTVKGTILFDGLECFTSCWQKHYDLPFEFSVGPEAVRTAVDQKISGFLSGATESMAIENNAATATPPDLGGLTGSLKGLAVTQPPAAMPEWRYSPHEAKPDFTIWAALFFGFLAGILLNAMPCVLPVLGIKVLSFTDASNKGRRMAVFNSLVFSAGVLTVFMLLAALATFANFSWGRQFQEPYALVGIIAVIVVFALGLFDAYLITVPGKAGNSEVSKAAGHWGDFLKGIFATILATPCSGPFLGAVLAWAVTQPPYIIFAVYGSIGAGMSFPYIILSSSRRASKLLPKPGAWMNDFKRLMGFLLLGFAAYLLFGLPDDMVESTVLFCITTSLAVVFYGRIAPFGSSGRRKSLSSAIAVALAGGGLYLSFFVVYPAFSVNHAATVREENKTWRPFSADSLLVANAAGRPTVVDFTANWCMNCQYNTIMVLSKKAVTGAIDKKGALALVVDMTMPDPVQDSLLHSLGSRSIPFLAIFPGDDPGHPIIMRDVLTTGRVLKAINGLKKQPR